MNAPSVDIRSYLIAAGIVNTANCFYSSMPQTPDACVCVYDTGGFAGEDIDAGLHHPTVQVMVRGRQDGYVTAMTLAQTINDTLHSINSETIGGINYIVTAIGEPAAIGPDKQGRPRFSSNFIIELEEA